MFLPITTIVGRALWFVPANLFTIIRLTWLPLALLVAAEWAAAIALIRDYPGQTFEQIVDADDMRYTLAVFLALAVQGFAVAVVAVQVHRVILFDERRPGQYFAFPFGWTEFLYVVMATLTFLFAMALMIAALAVLFIATTAIDGGGADVWATLANIGERGPTGLPFALVLVGTLLLWVLLIWLTMRLAVWPAAVVANRKLSLGEAWSLTRGSALALFAMFMLAVLGPAFVGGLVFYYLNANYSQTGVVVPVEIFAPLGDIEQKLKLLLQTGDAHPPPSLVLVDFAARILVTAYTIALISFAYKSLKGFDLDAPINEQADPTLDLPPGVKPMGPL